VVAIARPRLPLGRFQQPTRWRCDASWSRPPSPCCRRAALRGSPRTWPTGLSRGYATFDRASRQSAPTATGPVAAEGGLPVSCATVALAAAAVVWSSRRRWGIGVAAVSLTPWLDIPRQNRGGGPSPSLSWERSGGRARRQVRPGPKKNRPGSLLLIAYACGWRSARAQGGGRAGLGAAATPSAAASVSYAGGADRCWSGFARRTGDPAPKSRCRATRPPDRPPPFHTNPVTRPAATSIPPLLDLLAADLAARPPRVIEDVNVAVGIHQQQAADRVAAVPPHQEEALSRSVGNPRCQRSGHRPPICPPCHEARVTPPRAGDVCRTASKRSARGTAHPPLPPARRWAIARFHLGCQRQEDRRQGHPNTATPHRPRPRNASPDIATHPPAASRSPLPRTESSIVGVALRSSPRTRFR